MSSSRYCRCGSALTIAGGDDWDNLDVIDTWCRQHSGDGHAAATAQEARMKRNDWRDRPSTKRRRAEKTVRSDLNVAVLEADLRIDRMTLA